MEQECEERRAEVGRATWQQDDMSDTEREEGASGASARRQCRACVTPCPLYARIQRGDPALPEVLKRPSNVCIKH